MQCSEARLPHWLQETGQVEAARTNPTAGEARVVCCRCVVFRAWQMGLGSAPRLQKAGIKDQWRNLLHIPSHLLGVSHGLLDFASP